jgi:hypothetical protein
LDLVVAEEGLETDGDGDDAGEQEQEVKREERGPFGLDGEPTGRRKYEARCLFEQGAEADRSDEQISDHREPGQSHGNQNEGLYSNRAFGQSFSPHDQG